MMPRYSPRLCIVVASGALLVCLGTHVQAADEGGVGGLLQQLFGPSTQAAQQVAPAPGQATTLPEQTFADRRARRSDPANPPATAKLRLKTRYAALPEAEPLQVRVTDRQTPIDMSQGPTAALLKDDTLRPGDIVVMPGGARVFAGDPGKRHRMRDFERLEHSPLVDRKTRDLLAAMMVPIGAMPVHEARRVMARARAYRLPEASSVQAAAPTLRVIHPWMARP